MPAGYAGRSRGLPTPLISAPFLRGPDALAHAGRRNGRLLPTLGRSAARSRRLGASARAHARPRRERGRRLGAGDPDGRIVVATRSRPRVQSLARDDAAEREATALASKCDTRAL